jgi:hypothetical protein
VIVYLIEEGKNSGEKMFGIQIRMFLGIKDPDSCLFVRTDLDPPINKYKNKDKSRFLVL